MLTIKINKQLSAKLLRIMKDSPAKVSKGVTIALRRCGDQLRNEAANDAPVKSGNLKRSVTMEMFGDSKVVVGSNLEYARIHDQGGTIRAHTIYPKKKKFLAFQIGGRWVFAKKVNIPARTVKPFRDRGYLTPAFEKLAKGDAQKFFTEEIMRAIQ